MRSYGAAALVALAIVTECLGASDRSRQRSGPIRSVPVAANVKRDVDFDCPEEFGYYPHPTDCSLYYVCVFGGALLESCTGGLMYSHELQTCDWPRNVGCDGGTAAGGEELERISEREPPPPPRQAPHRTPPPPPPPRAQPNPIITSRGQPKFNRDEYEKQQQLYAEIDDLPPVEEIESDRQQRVYRGQPSTIGQVQKDRDGYSAQVVSSGRNLNSNIIPASIPQNSGKIGSFSFGSQVDDRRTVTQAPQRYNEDKKLTDSHDDRLLDIVTNEIKDAGTRQSRLLSRRRRDADKNIDQNEAVNNTDNVLERKDAEESVDLFETDTDSEKYDHDSNQRSFNETDRGKRQIRYYLKNGYKIPSKNWAVLKPIHFLDTPHTNYNPTSQSNRYQQAYDNANKNNYYDSGRPSYTLDSNSYSAANPFFAYQNSNYQGQRPFKASLPDIFNQRPTNNPLNVATQIITKSPPISSLNNHNSFVSGGFYNNAPQNNYQFSSQAVTSAHPNNRNVYQDSSLLPSIIVTNKPIPMPTSPRSQNSYDSKEINHPKSEKDYDDEEASEEEESSKENEYNSKEHYPKPPFEFTHPSNKFADIENPFANPNFDFDTYLSKLSNGQYSTHNPNKVQHAAIKNIYKSFESSTPAQQSSPIRSSTINYQGMSTPRPFSVLPSGAEAVFRPISNPHSQVQQNNEKYIQESQPSQQTYQQLQQSSNSNSFNQQQQYYNENNGKFQNAGIPLERLRPKLKPPNFNDDRQLPITYSFSRPINITAKSNNNQKFNTHASPIFTVTAKPYLIVSSTGNPVQSSSPEQQYVIKKEKISSQQPSYYISTGKPYMISSVKPYNNVFNIQQSTTKPFTTLANEQLRALHQFWSSSTPPVSSQLVTLRPSTTPDIDKLRTLFSQAISSSVRTPTNEHNFNKQSLISTTTLAPKRRPIPKPSPEMNDYYYDDDDYYEPPIKSQYMPSTEVKPQRPPMAQNDKEYDESYEDSEEEVVNIRPKLPPRKPTKISVYKPEIVTKNYNDVSVITKTPSKDFTKSSNGKISVPILMDFISSTPSVLVRPDISNYEISHYPSRNRTLNLKKPSANGAFTPKPPKYLNETTLRPYTVRHRLAKPTTVQEHITQNDEKVTRGRPRHPNIVAQMLTTQHDNYNQETLVTKSKYDGRTNSLEPTESVSPYSPSPRPKMLYNGSQSYNSDQYDPFYAIYDEDGELYKDTDYVQQYNLASVRPAVQQTYRGTPPPARRPVETYTPRPVSPDDYDDALIQGQINNQNQYQPPTRQSTRGEGNELGFEHIPSSVKTTLYEATPISTTPTTTSTSTTTQRQTTAPFTEAMIPSRYTTRSSTDESPSSESDLFSNHNSSKESISSVPSTPSPTINFSSLAKPFEKTDYVHSSVETLSTTEKLQANRQNHVTNYNNKNSAVRSEPNTHKKKYVSLTTGFSIRRNSNNSNNPYTVTVLSRPFDEFGKSNSDASWKNTNPQANSNQYYYDSSSIIRDSNEHSVKAVQLDKNPYESLSENTMRRKDAQPEIRDGNDIPVYIRPTGRTRTNILKDKSTTTPTTTTTKYYLKSVIKRPAPFSKDNKYLRESTENAFQSVQSLIESGLHNVARAGEIAVTPTNNTVVDITPKRRQHFWNRPNISPYETLENLHHFNKKEVSVHDSTTNAPPTTRLTSDYYFKSRDKSLRSKPLYYSYRIEDEVVPDQTTEIFSSSVKNVIKAFFNTLVSTPAPIISTPKTEPNVVNIGYRKKLVQYTDEKPLHQNEQRLQIITEPTVNKDGINPRTESKNIEDKDEMQVSKDFSSSSTTMTPMNTVPYIFTSTPTSSVHPSFNQDIYDYDSYHSKFKDFLINTSPVINYESTTPNLVEQSRKFHNIITVEATSEQNISTVNLNDKEIPKSKTLSAEFSEIERHIPLSEVVSEIASTTSTTKSTTTTTVKIDPTTKSTTKSVSFPTRTSRINPAIKLAATNPGSGRRSYQSSSKCSSDNSLQANPKCNEIKYQRPTSTRGRGSAHYSTLSGNDSPQPVPNRGTPPTRSRPTLKPSTVIVSKTTEFVDIYANAPTRPAPVYPQPTPDKTAAKCRKDVCLLPDCYCGGKDIPGDLAVESVPQIVLLTFDDSVNDLNKGLYADLFEKGRVNPNGCPISATFYVSHEWTDYSQVQNLYAAGHEMASHTISHSFGEQFSQKKWNREVGGQREFLAAYGGVKLEDVRGMRAPFLSIGGNKMFKMLYDSNFTYDSSMPVYENRPPSWPYTLDYKIFHDCMIPPCPTKSYPGVWEVPMVMWQDLNGGRCSMGDACANPPEAEGVYKMLLKNFDRHYTTNRAPFGLYYHAAWFTQPHHKAGFIMFLDFINQMQDVWIITNWQALQWVRDPTPISRLNNFQPFQCNYQGRPKKCNNPKVCNLWHKSGVRYMRTCQPCPEVYPWTGKSGIRSSRIDNDNGE